MIFNGFTVVHQKLGAITQPDRSQADGDCRVELSIEGFSKDAFIFRSCQRRLSVFFGAPSALNLVGHDAKTQAHTQVYTGIAAYAFLLQVATGLESEMIGETEVFGQLKAAWQEYQARGAQAANLRTVMSRLFEDTKEIRSRHLRGLGGQSYGSIIRKVLGPQSATVFIVGAGAFAQSILPWISQHDLILTNRTRDKAEALKNSRKILPGSSHQKYGTQKILDWHQKWTLSEMGEVKPVHILLCVPGVAPGESNALAGKIIALAHEIRVAHRLDHSGLVLDLGEPPVLSEKDTKPAFEVSSGLVKILRLNDLYAIQKQEEATRRQEVARARQACMDKAIERDALATITLPYGWEDLWALQSV